MRITLFAGLAVAAGALLWLFTARSLGLLIDRVHVSRLSETPVHELAFSRGTFEVAGVSLNSLTTETLPSGLTMTAQLGRAVIEYQGQTFPCGPSRGLNFTPDAGDAVTLITERSHLSWPVPFEMNFMTGVVPTWKRHCYTRLHWLKRSGARLEIVWRIEQGLFHEGGWRPPTMEYITAGLLRVEIKQAADLQASAIKYLARTRHWERSVYRLESQGPSADGRTEIIAAIHHADEHAARPGAGQSVTLLLDYQTRKVTREMTFQ